ncbi:MAG: DUF1598 domain-containing protein [Pirellulales bacterium]
MSSRDFLRLPAALRATAACVAVTYLALLPCQIFAQNNNNNNNNGGNNGGGFITTRAVGGVAIDTEGILQSATVDAQGQLRQLRLRALQEIPGDLNQPTELRKISLRGIEAAIEKHRQDGKPLPDAIRYLAGLQRIRYVFVYPEQNDIVLAGPAEGWRVDPRGNVVGATTGRPVLLLDDLLVALRTARPAAQTGISCSIDPTAEGLARLQRLTKQLRNIGPDPKATLAGIEKTLGYQTITVTGVPADSHFARVMVAADYRMKRLAMNFEEPPVRGLPSFLEMMKAGSRGMQNMLPRWWLAPNYDPLLTDEGGLAWEFRAAGVKAMTEEDYVTASGARQHTGKANPVAQKWADNMTAKYAELAVADPVFGELRNCMDLAVVGALVVKEDLAGKAGYSMPILLDSSLATEEFCAPKKVDSIASCIKKGSTWLISASGGVQLSSWAVADKHEPSKTLAPVRAKATPAKNANWWWN